MSDTINPDNPCMSFWVIEDNTQFLDELVHVMSETEDLKCIGTFGDINELEHFLNTTASITLPDTVLMDIRLPGKSGIEGTKYLRERYPDLTIVMLTLHDDVGNIFDALRAGASGYLLKGLPFDQTLAAIRNAGRGWVSMPDTVATKVLGYFSAKPDKDKYQLTAREYDVLVKMCDGLTHREIAKKLFISEHTVNQHIKTIYVKLHVNTKAAAVARALRDRIVG